MFKKWICIHFLMTEYNFLQTKEYVDKFMKELEDKGVSLSEWSVDRRMSMGDKQETITFYLPLKKDINLYEIQQRFTQHSSKLEARRTPGVSFTLEDPSLNFSVSFYEGPVHGVTYNKFGKISKEELDTILNLYAELNNKTETKDPKRLLEDFGASIYLPRKELTWDSIAGYDEIKKQLQENVLLPFTNPEIFNGITDKTRKMQESNLPKAVLLYGPPGTCKTVSAKVIAGQINVPFIYVPLKAFLSKWYSESENRMAGIFEAADLYPSSILFIDEIDAISEDRDGGDSNESSKRVLSVILKKTDGIEAKGKSLLLGATNRKPIIDPALLSRFDTMIYFPLPTMDERGLIFETYAKQLDKKSLEKLAKETDDFSGRNIKDVCGYAERICGARLIKEGLNEGTPTLDEYKQAITVRKLSDLSLK